MKIFKNKLVVVVVILSITFLVLIGLSTGRNNVSFVESGVSSVVGFVQKGIYHANVSTKDFFGFVFNFYDVKEENDKLKKENNELKNELVSYYSLKSENKSLKKDLSIKDTLSDYSYKGAQVVGKSSGDWSDEFVINIGSNDGVTKEMVVVAGEGLVGKVTSVGKNSAKIETLSSENISVGAAAVNRSQSEGAVRGYTDSDDKTLAEMYFLPSTTDIKEGDTVVTSGTGNIYPKNIRIGTVKSLVTDKIKGSKDAIIKPFVDFSKLQEVFVVIPKDKIEIKY